MASALNEIRAPIANELKQFEIKFRAALKSSVPLLDRITYYIVKHKGKQIRPLFVLLSSKVFGEINEASYRAAALVELLHTATLVHDDVVDDAFLRRGFLSINALWKNKIAVLVGDYLLAKGLLLSLENDDFQTLKLLSRSVKLMSEGELLQIEKARKLDIKEEIYFEIIRQKTASLIASSCASGAATSGANKEEVDKMQQFGEFVGMAFQIKDDLLDFGYEKTGKIRGTDIKDKKLTLPLIHTLNTSTKADKRKIMHVIKKGKKDPKQVDEVIKMVNQNGGLVYAEKIMHKYKDDALAILKTLPQGDASAALQKLVLFTTERKK